MLAKSSKWKKRTRAYRKGGRNTGARSQQAWVGAVKCKSVEITNGQLCQWYVSALGLPSSVVKFDLN